MPNLWQLACLLSVILVATTKLVAGCSMCYANDSDSTHFGGANDIVVVRQNDGTFKATQLHVRYGWVGWHAVKVLVYGREGQIANLTINGKLIDFEAVKGTTLKLQDSGNVYIERPGEAKTCFFSNAELSAMNLTKGRNSANLTVPKLGEAEIHFYIHLLEQDDRLVVSDLDGTINEQEVALGTALPLLNIDVHFEFIIELFDKMAKNGYHLIYLTARPLGMTGLNRDYIFNKLQNKSGYSMPLHPLFMAPVPVDNHKSHPKMETKACAVSTLMNLFDAGKAVFVGAYGNEETDLEAYRMAGIPDEKIFMVKKDEEGESYLKNVGTGTNTSYAEQAKNVDSIYPKRG